mgnify:CR=1 FL=1
MQITLAIYRRCPTACSDIDDTHFGFDEILKLLINLAKRENIKHKVAEQAAKSDNPRKLKMAIQTDTKPIGPATASSSTQAGKSIG